MKILYVFSGAKRGETTGQTVIALSLVKKAQEMGHEVHVISTYRMGAEIFKENGVSFYFIKGDSDFKTYLLNIYRIIKFGRSVRPDIMHVQGHLLIPFMYFLNKFIKARMVCTLVERIGYFRGLYKFLIIYSIKKVGMCIVPSGFIKKSLISLGVLPEIILIARIGLREDLLILESRNQNYDSDIFYIGDASRERGFDIVCALAELLPNVRFTFLIRWQKDCSDLYKKIFGFKNVFIKNDLVKSDKLREFITKSRLVMLPFRWMGVMPPMTLVEAMALSKCVITTRQAIENEYMVDKKNVVLVDSEVAIEEMKEKVLFLLNNPALMEKIGREASRIIGELYSELEYKKVFISYEIIFNNYYEWRMFKSNGGNLISRKEIDVLLNLLKPVSGDNILDVGTGSGRLARAVIKSSKVAVHGLDPDRKILEEGQKLKTIFLSEDEGNLYQVTVGNGEKLPFADNIFDKVFCFRVLKYYNDPWKGIDELTRVIKPGGILVLEIVSNKSWESIFNPIISKVFKRKKIYHFWEEKVTNFNCMSVKKYLNGRGVAVIDEVALHKVPPLLYLLFNNTYINYVLELIDRVLLKVTPKIFFSKSIILKCKKT